MYLSSGDCLSGHPGQLAKAGGPRQRLQGHPGGELPLQAMITLELRWDLKVITKQLMLLRPSWGYNNLPHETGRVAQGTFCKEGITAVSCAISILRVSEERRFGLAPAAASRTHMMVACLLQRSLSNARRFGISAQNDKVGQLRGQSGERVSLNPKHFVQVRRSWEWALPYPLLKKKQTRKLFQTLL